MESLFYGCRNMISADADLSNQRKQKISQFLLLFTSKVEIVEEHIVFSPLIMHQVIYNCGGKDSLSCSRSASDPYVANIVPFPGYELIRVQKPVTSKWFVLVSSCNVIDQRICQ